MATPLLVALIAIETTDLVFALDSIPAVFGITRNLFVVFTSSRASPHPDEACLLRVDEVKRAPVRAGR